MSTTLLGSTLQTVRTAHDLSVRELARRAGTSHTQISRIEAGEVATPSRDVLVKLAQALDRNPAPLLVLAGYLRNDRARLVLAPMFRPGAELPEAWVIDPGVSLEEAVAIVGDARSSHEQLMQVAAGVFEVPDTDETLWEASYSYAAGDEEDEELELLGIWRYVRGERRSDFLSYGRALRELADLEYIVERDRLGLRAIAAPTEQSGSPEEIEFRRAALEAAGFDGFLGVRLLRDGCSQVPDDPGVYAVLRIVDRPVAFLSSSVGGAFKGRDPSIEISRLEAEWIEGVEVLYIGSAGNLRRRVDQLTRFGRGEPVGHWGGRALWQIADHDELIVAWQPATDPVGREAVLLDTFRQQHGRLPFANLRAVIRR